MISSVVKILASSCYKFTTPYLKYHSEFLFSIQHLFKSYVSVKILMLLKFTS